MNSIIKKITKQLNVSNLFFVFGIFLIIIIWVISYQKIDNEMVVPSASSVLERIISFIQDRDILAIFIKTILKVFIIIGISFVNSLILSIVSYKFKWFKGMISPFLVIIRTAPIAAIIIILLIAIGLESTPNYICAFVIIPIMYEQFLHSFESIDKDILEETKMISNIDLKIVFKVIIPLSMPGIITSILSVFGLGLKVLVMAEIFSSSDDTFGGLLQIYRSVADMTSIFALTIILIIIVLIVEMILKKIQKKIKDLR